MSNSDSEHRSNMFNLEQAMREWRRKMTAAGIKTPVPLEELENHLREEIEQQLRSGANSERAFETAVQKIGSASALQSEFKKVDVTRKERDRALELRKLTFILANLASLLSYSALFKPDSVWQLTSGQRISCLAAASTFTLLVWIGRFGYRLFPVICARRTRDLIGALVGAPVLLWWIVSIYLILPRCEFTLGPLLVAIYWGLFAPAGVVFALVMGFEAAARKKGAMAVS